MLLSEIKESEKQIISIKIPSSRKLIRFSCRLYLKIFLKYISWSEFVSNTRQMDHMVDGDIQPGHCR